jgi:hypothetical protein
MTPTDGCEMPAANASTDEMDRILREAKTIAVVGLSANPDRPSHDVSVYLRAAGYRIIPVNPGQAEILGERAYARVADIPEFPDVVQLFLRPEHIPQAVDDAIRKGAKAVWMQSGVVHNEAADRARKAGLAVVMNRCMKVEHRRALAAGELAPR